MSRARDWTDPVTGELHWFDVHGMPSVRELELLAEAEDTDLDDLLDANLSSKEVIFRLNKLSELVPEAGLIKSRRREAMEPAVCCICPVEGWECQGRITRHHFVPKWVMLELKDYELYAPRSICTVPVCLGAHKFLHKRYGNGASKSIAKYLSDDEKALAHKLIKMLRKERPKIYALLAGGDKTSYEWQLIQDWRRELFNVRGLEKEPFERWRLRNSL